MILCRDIRGLPSTRQQLFESAGRALAQFREALNRGAKDEADWNDRLIAYTNAFPDLASELKSSLRGELPAG